MWPEGSAGHPQPFLVVILTIFKEGFLLVCLSVKGFFEGEAISDGFLALSIILSAAECQQP